MGDGVPLVLDQPGQGPGGWLRTGPATGRSPTRAAALAQYPDPEDIHAVSAQAYQEWYAAKQGPARAHG